LGKEFLVKKSKESISNYMEDPKLLKSQINTLVKLLEVQENTILEQVDKLDQALQQNRQILESAGEGIYGLDMNGNTTFVNPAAEQMMGYSAEEMIGKPQHSLIHHTHADGTVYPREECHIYAAVNDGKVHQEDGEVFWRKDGTSFPVEYASTPIYENKKIVGAVVTFRDISDRKESEENQKIEADIVVLLEKIGNEVNKDLHLKDVLKFSLEQICELTHWQIGHVYLCEPDRPDYLESSKIWYLVDPVKYSEFQKVTENTNFEIGIGLPGRVLKSKTVEWINDIHKDTNFPRNKLLINTPLKGGFAFPMLIHNEVAGVLEFFSDKLFSSEIRSQGQRLQAAGAQIGVQLGRVLERKRAREETLKAKEIAESANRAKTNFLANMSHEIRTPLNAILGYAQILMRKNSLDFDTKDALETINRSGINLLDMINEILDLSKIEAGQMEFNPHNFDLYDLVDGMSKLFELRCKEKGLNWVVAGVEEGHNIFGDEVKIRQVLINLIGNAVKFTDSGNVVFKVYTLDNNQCYFEVVDTGQGIPEEIQKNIFQPFRQGTEGYTKGGTGLGLAISKKQLGLMGASLELESKVGKGSRFHFTLQLPMATGEVHKRSERFGKVIRLAKGHNVKALVVDDVMENRDVLRLLLSDIGVEVTCAENGVEALEQLSQSKPDIIFMDIWMPVMDGEEAIVEIQKDYGPDRFKIVAITASALGQLEGKYEKLGFHDYISKPYQDGQVFASLKNLLGVDFEFEDDLTEEDSGADEIDFSNFSIPKDIFQRLKKAAENYNITEVEKCLKLLAEGDDSFVTFVKRLNELLKKYDMEEIQHILEEVKVDE
jgi:PAS domain S-box-containing protein